MGQTRRVGVLGALVLFGVVAPACDKSSNSGGPRILARSVSGSMHLWSEARG